MRDPRDIAADTPINTVGRPSLSSDVTSVSEILLSTTGGPAPTTVKYPEERMQDNQVTGQPTLAEQSNEVAHVVGVMSGKGGVGKSLVAGLLACALRMSGREVGILDADITGPSIPKMFGIAERPDMSELGIFPVATRTGIRTISINLFLEKPGDSVIWRGPIISNTVKQFWQEVFWGKLDYLLVDLPPGTADVPLTVMQSLPLDCVVIVTSPQDLAAMVVRKAVDMCNKMKTPVLGLVQNMAWLKCDNCGEIVYPFGKSTGEQVARDMGIPHLLDLPIDPEISARCDAGTIEDYSPNPVVGKIDLFENAVAAIQHTRKLGGECNACDASGGQ
jgi:Mrp family chromosome partitioning ATPase